jgi:hypothetical protein
LRPNQSAAANGLSAVRSSVAGVRERTVRSTAAAEAVAELGSLGDFARMSDLNNFAAQLEACIGGQTLASLRDEAAKEMNGTCWRAVRADGQPRMMVLCCFTGEHEIRRLGDIDASRAERFGDWSAVSLAEAVARAMMRGGFCYDFDKSSSRSAVAPVVLIAAGEPRSIANLETVLGLQP